MKNILFPTDFSQASINALPFALATAQKTKAKVVIVHAYQVPRNTHLSGIDIKRRAEEKIQQLLAEQPATLLKKVTISSFVMLANKLQLLHHLAKACDLVIMGTKQLTRWYNQRWERITLQLMKTIKTPLIVIPEHYTFKKFQKIVFSVDNAPIRDRKGLQILKELTSRFQAELILFHTEEQATDRGIHYSVLASFDDTADYRVDYNFIQKDTLSSIRDMVSDYNVDLVGLVRRKRNWLQSIFHQSITEQEVLESQVPLLILHDD
ncbi:MAG: universal stress protein [Bacteroidota bacterium]